jgi:uncharacterized protein
MATLLWFVIACPVGLAAIFLLQDRLLYMRSVGRPVAVAEHDRIVPARFSIALYESLKGPKHLMLIKAADHNDWPDRVDASWWQEAINRTLGEKH